MRTNLRRVPWPFKMIGVLILVPGIIFFITWAAWMLWNALMPELFGLTALTYWQVMGLLVLAKLIFSGPGRHGFPKTGFSHHPPRYKDRDAWRRHLKEKFGPDSDTFHSGPYGPGRRGGGPGWFGWNDDWQKEEDGPTETPNEENKDS